MEEEDTSQLTFEQRLVSFFKNGIHSDTGILAWIVGMLILATLITVSVIATPFIGVAMAIDWVKWRFATATSPSDPSAP
jgi:hypothetical protein